MQTGHSEERVRVECTFALKVVRIMHSASTETREEAEAARLRVEQTNGARGGAHGVPRMDGGIVGSRRDGWCMCGI